MSTSQKNHRVAKGTTTPIADVRPEASRDAAGEGTYDSSAAARSTRSRVPSETLAEPRSERDTVDGDTPARRATSRIPAMAAGSGAPTPTSCPPPPRPGPLPGRPGVPGGARSRHENGVTATV